MENSLKQRLLAYFLTPFLALGLAFFGLRFDRVDIETPLTISGDALLILPMVKARLETGTHWRNERLGAPGIQELHDFPVVDHLHFGILQLLGCLGFSPVAAFNVYYLLTYPLTALSTLFVLRVYGLRLTSAMSAAFLYAFLPYHWQRGVWHYFLAAYWVIPLSMLLFLPLVEDNRKPLTWKRLLWGFVIAILTASAGAYYAFFTAALLAFAGCRALVAERDHRGALIALVSVLAITLAGIVNHWPAIAAAREFGHNSAVHERDPVESEVYGLKFIHLILPIREHHLRPLANWRSAYEAGHRPLENENTVASLGILGSSGLLFLGALFLIGRGNPASRTVSSWLLFALLLGTIGGLGSVFNFFVSAQVRAYNRISIFIAFFAIAAICQLLEQIPRFRIPVLIAVTLLGLWDQTPRWWFSNTPVQQAEEREYWYHRDAEFFGAIEEKLGGGGQVFTLPYCPYPETLKLERIGGYDPVRGYLHTRTTKWSFGAMRGREIDLWQRTVVLLPAREFLLHIMARDFTGLFIDQRGFATNERLRELRTILGEPTILHTDGNQLFFDLRPYRQTIPTEELNKIRKSDDEAVSLLWYGDFASYEPLGYESRHRWCGPKGILHFVNPTGRARHFHVSMLLRTETEDSADLKIEGTTWTERMPIDCHSAPIERDLVIPPGRSTVTFRCRPPESFRPRDSRRQAFFIAAFQMVER